MKNFATWTLPVAVSLLLHAIIMVLALLNESGTQPEKIQQHSISVELLGKASMSVSSAQLKSSKLVEPVNTSLKSSQDVVTIPPESQATIPVGEQTSSPTQEAIVVTDTAQSSMQIHSLSKLTRPPAFLRKIEPVYPAAERRAGAQASVLAEVTIDDKGIVQSVRIVKSVGKNFDEAVIEALKKSVFVPGYIDKEAVAVRVLVPFRFNLN